MILIFYRRDVWWRYVLFGAFASVIPASLTRDAFHMLRLSAFPIFMITLTIPAIMWLAGRTAEVSETDPDRTNGRSVAVRRTILAGALLFTLVQTVLFQIDFRRDGTKRGLWFDESYPRLVQTALSMPDRPIYLVDGYWGQAYPHAYWYAIVHKLDPSTFVHVEQGKRPPAGGLVISSEDKCVNCEMIRKDDPFLLYRERPPAPVFR